MKVKTITFTVEARFDAEGIAKDFQKQHPELVAFAINGPFETSDSPRAFKMFRIGTMKGKK